MPTLYPPLPHGPDDTNLLNDWFDGLPFGTIAVFDKSTPYWCESVVSINQKVGLIVNGISLRRVNQHARKPSGAEDNHAVEHLNIRSSMGIQIVDPDIIGPKLPDTGYTNAQEGQHGIGIHASSQVLVEGGHIQHVHGDFIYLAARAQTRPSDIVITDNTGFDAGRHAICITACDHAEIHRNTMTGFHRYGLHKERSRKGDGWTDINESENIFHHA